MAKCTGKGKPGSQTVTCSVNAWTQTPASTHVLTGQCTRARRDGCLWLTGFIHIYINSFNRCYSSSDRAVNYFHFLSLILSITSLLFFCIFYPYNTMSLFLCFFTSSGCWKVCSCGLLPSYSCHLSILSSSQLFNFLSAIF